jgi:hypothetical protein
VAALGTVAGALPVVALREPGPLTLVLAVGAGVAAAAALLSLLRRPVLRELVALAASVRRRG